MTTAKHKTESERHVAFWKRPAWHVFVLWSAFLGMQGYYLLLEYRNVPHPSYRPLAIFVLLQSTALMAVVVFGLLRLVRGPQRVAATAWLALGLLPVFLWYSQISLAIHVQEDRRKRQVEMHPYLLTTSPVGAALVDGAARWTLPHRLEGERVVMFCDDAIPDPQRDLQEMDAFIKAEEAFLQTTMPAKIHWVRTPLVGRYGGFAVPGLSVANPEASSPGEPHTVSRLDFHEASHNVIGLPGSFAIVNGTYPPTFFIEGCPTARTEPWNELAILCRRLKADGRDLSLREAVSPEFYNQTEGRIYLQGGAFTHVLLDKFGPEKFWELYHTTGRLNVTERLEEIYDMSLEELDALFWSEIEACFAAGRSYEKATEDCSPHEKMLLDELRKACDHQRHALKTLCENVTLEWTTRTSYRHKDRRSTGTTESRFQSKEGYARKYSIARHTEASDAGDEETQRIDCTLLTPNARFYTFQFSSSEPDKDMQHAETVPCSPDASFPERKRMTRRALTAFDPMSLSLTEYRHGFSDPDDYLWNPPPGTVIEKVVEEGDDVVLTLKTTANERRRSTLTIRFDRGNHWLPREATCTEIFEDNNRYEWRDVREYDTESTGFPILETRRVERTHTDDDGNTAHQTQVTELTRRDTSPPPDAVFLPTDMPLEVEHLLPKDRPPHDIRLQRHLRIITLWLAVPLIVIVMCRGVRWRRSNLTRNHW